MAAGDDKIVRVRGGPKGFRMITLAKFKAEKRAKKGKRLPNIDASPRAKKMDAKRKRNRKRKKKS
jgi:hypothetical protein